MLVSKANTRSPRARVLRVFLRRYFAAGADRNSTEFLYIAAKRNAPGRRLSNRRAAIIYTIRSTRRKSASFAAHKLNYQGPTCRARSDRAPLDVRAFCRCRNTAREPGQIIMPAHRFTRPELSVVGSHSCRSRARLWCVLVGTLQPVRPHRCIFSRTGRRRGSRRPIPSARERGGGGPGQPSGS